MYKDDLITQGVVTKIFPTHPGEIQSYMIRWDDHGEYSYDENYLSFIPRDGIGGNFEF